MRQFANLFLTLFLLDGGISLLDELVSLLASVTPLSEMRTFIANIAILMAVAVYLCLGLDRRLPKRVFLPPILFVFWCPLFTWIFPALAVKGYGIAAAAAQVGVGLLPLYHFREGRGHSLSMPESMFAVPWFSFRNTLLFALVNVFVIPCAVALLVLHEANSYMVEHTRGFMRVGPEGLYMTERVYLRDRRTIRLAGMIHVGDRKYYDDLAGSIIPGRTIVLAEGVTDEDNLLQNRFNYGRVADFLGLTTQGAMLFHGRMIEPEALDEQSLRPPPNGEKAGLPDILRADVDVSSFRPPTILLLDTIGKILKESPSLLTALQSLNGWAQKNLTPEMHAIIMDDILHRRNRQLIGYLEKALDRYDTVVVPWGALHMKEIEEEVLKEGFSLQQQHERISVDFRRMFLSGIDR